MQKAPTIPTIVLSEVLRIATIWCIAAGLWWIPYQLHLISYMAYLMLLTSIPVLCFPLVLYLRAVVDQRCFQLHTWVFSTVLLLVGINVAVWPGILIFLVH